MELFNWSFYFREVWPLERVLPLQNTPDMPTTRRLRANVFLPLLLFFEEAVKKVHWPEMSGRKTLRGKRQHDNEFRVELFLALLNLVLIEAESSVIS